MTWTSIFLKLTMARSGNVDGESVDAAYPRLIEVSKLDFGIDLVTPDSDSTIQARDGSDPKPALSALPPTRPSRAATRAQLKDLEFTKRFDIASAVLLRALNAQEQISEAVFTLLKPELGAAGARVPFMVVRLSSAFVENIDIGLEQISGHGSGQGGLAVEESITLRYREISIDHFVGQGQAKALNFSHSKG